MRVLLVASLLVGIAATSTRAEECLKEKLQVQTLTQQVLQLQFGQAQSERLRLEEALKTDEAAKQKPPVPEKVGPPPPPDKKN
jgi:hypothetical protein